MSSQFPPHRKLAPPVQPNHWQFISIYDRKHLIVEVQASLRPRLRHISLLYIFVCEDTQKLCCIQVQLKIKRHFNNAILLPVKPFASVPGRLKGCGSPWWDASMCAVIQVEEILSICCELWFDNQQELNNYWVGNVFCEYMMSAVSRILTWLRHLLLTVSFQFN